MKELSIKEFEVMLCSTGYLPPRNEEELSFFEQMYECHTSRLAGKHVDVDSIINGTCRMVSILSNEENKQKPLSLRKTENINCGYSMAARNFEKLPKEILDKMMHQHKLKKDDE